ncbi:MAG: peptidylprolyl isomerase [Burkholderiales bacterium]|nr:peptidylprolyl isomerase [Burkholderiales bacterium]
MTPTLKHVLIAIALLLGALTQAPASAGDDAPGSADGPDAIPLNRIVALVNRDIVTRLELEDRIAIAADQLRKQGVALPPRNILEKQVLEAILLQRIQLSFARENGIRVDETQLDRAVARIAEDNQLTVEQFRTALARDGIRFDRFRDDIRKEIILSRLREREVASKVVVSEGEIDEYLVRRAESGVGTEWLASHILVRVDEKTADPVAIKRQKEKADQALAALNSGDDFAKVAATYSEAGDALQGGDLGWRNVDRMPSLFLEMIGKLKVGQHSAVVRSSAGFHIVKLRDLRGAVGKQVLITQHKARHILVKPTEIVSDADAQRRLRDLRERIEQGGSTFADLAKQHSQDGSAASGGELGWMAAADLVPEFAAAMEALPVGQLSQPVRSPFGWHLLQVLERREADVSKERERLEARQAIRSRKADEAYDEWLRQLRDSAYVELRLEES